MAFKNYNLAIYHYYYKAKVFNRTDNNMSSNTTIRNFTVDLTNPIIRHHIITTVFNGSLYGQINFTDEREIYSINVTWLNGSQLFGGSNMATTVYILNISNTTDTTVSNSITARVCDSHTSISISDFKDVKYEDSGIKFVENKKFLFWDDNFIKVYPKISTDYVEAITNKLTDKYQFTFNKKTDATTEVFVIESTYFIDIIKSDFYKGHLVIGNKYWLDFENEDVTKVIIKRINDNKVEITLEGLKGKVLEFNSIGELNCVQEIINFGNLNPVGQSIVVGKQGSISDITLDVTIEL